MRALKVIHVLRAPVGGLFRHVRDLVAAQAAMGLEVGVVCDSRSADALTLTRLEALRPHLALGLHLVAMTRDVGWRDYTAFAAVRDLAARTGVDVLHGHGAKGGAYARLAAGSLQPVRPQARARSTRRTAAACTTRRRARSAASTWRSSAASRARRTA